jgi:hypothetical protein
LAYEPGRYTDPQPTQGGGFPFQSLGAIPIAAILVWMFSGKSRRFELGIVGSVLTSLSMWFVLSEQSRYIVGLFFPACVLAGGAMSVLRVGPLLAGASILQLLASLVVYTRFPDPDSRFSEKLKVVIGGQTADEYQHRFTGFFDAAQELNKLPGHPKVALFDQVFGFLLDIDYYWANPGHSTEIGYEHINTAAEFVDSLNRLGITHVYIDLSETFGGDHDLSQQWLQAAGISSPTIRYPHRADQMKDPQNVYKVLLAESVASGKIVPVKQVRSGIIFQVR